MYGILKASREQFSIYLIFANGVVNDPYVFAHFHLSSQVITSAAVDCHADDLLTLCVAGGVGGGGVKLGGGVGRKNVSCYAMRSSSLALRTRDPKGRRVAMFRHNCGCQLWSQLGNLAKENLL